MNINVNRQTTGRIPGKPSSGIVRRALGDITNVANDSKDVPQVVKPTAIVKSHPENVHIFESEEESAVVDRSYMLRAVDDIDSRDKENPLQASTCVSTMYKHFKVLETKFQVNLNYMDKQDFVNEKMRGILADWLVRSKYDAASCQRHSNSYLTSTGRSSSQVQTGS